MQTWEGPGKGSFRREGKGRKLVFQEEGGGGCTGSGGVLEWREGGKGNAFIIRVEMEVVYHTDRLIWKAKREPDKPAKVREFKRF